MRAVSVLVVICALSIASVLFASEPGTLVVSAEPPSQVFVDGEDLGITPLRVQVDPGEHRIEIRLDETKHKTLFKTVDAGKRTFVTYYWH